MYHFHCLNVRKGITSALLGLFLLWGNCGLWAQEFRFERIGEREGLLQKSIFAGIQDNKGYLWFGTDGGLVRYDGYQFKAYQYDPNQKNSLSSSKVYSVFADSKGRIWAGMQPGGGLNLLNPDGETFTHYFHDPENENSLLASNAVFAFLEDQDGNIWLGMGQGDGLSRLNPETGRFTHYQHDPNDPDTMTSGAIWHLAQDRKGDIWVGTMGGGLDRLDPQSGAITHYTHDPEDPHSIAHNSIGEILEDREGNMWIATWGGLNKLDPKTGNMTLYAHDPNNPKSLTGNTIWDLYEDEEGLIWVATFGEGLNALNPRTGHIRRYRHDPNNSSSLSGDQLWFIMRDRGGLFWIGTMAGGLNKFNPKTEAFEFYTHNPKSPISLAHRDAFAITEGQGGHLWIGCGTDGFQHFELETGTMKHYLHDPENSNSLNDDWVQSVYEDRSGMVWVGTYRKGLNRYDPDTETFSHFPPDPNDPSTLSDTRVWRIVEDHTGTLWIGTTVGLNRMIVQEDNISFERFLNDPEDPQSLSDNKVIAIHEDRSGALWVGSNRGLNKRIGDRQFKRYYSDVENPNSLPHNMVTFITEDDSGDLWIGTNGGVVRLDPATETFTRFSKQEGLTNSSISGLVFDDDGVLWISSKSGLTSFNQTTGRIQTYGPEILQSYSFRQGAALKIRDSRLAFGTSNGLYIIDPKKIQEDTRSFPLVLTQLRILNQPAPLRQNLASPAPIELSYRDVMFSFEFAALDYAYPAHNQYHYTLEGFDKEWMDIGTKHRATFTNLPGGDYVFKVKGANSRGVWSPEELVIPIHITAPPWKRWWAYCLYALLMGLALWGAEKTFERKKREREQERHRHAIEHKNQQLEVAHTQLMESQQEAIRAQKRAETANQAKSVFLANMSHELRSPLNAILGFAQVMARSSTLPSEHQENLGIIRRSGEHLLTLINQVLDLSKIEAGRTSLNSKNFDLHRLLHDIQDLFALRTETKGLHLLFEQDESVPRYVCTDEVKLRQVLINLLNNAIKFTDEGGVVVRVNSEKLTVKNGEMKETFHSALFTLHFEIEDSGAGIAPEEMDKVFEAFGQTESGRQSQEGTGLGLPISRKFVQLMGGDMQVKSQVGHGTLFTFEIQVQVVEATDLESHAPTRRAIALEPGQPRYRILVVDDRRINRQLVVKLLKPFAPSTSSGQGFELREASNGQEAIDIWDTWKPHLIWMDMRMPVLDGYGATKRIKAMMQDRETVIIALTASSLEEERAVVLNAGCDDFLRKPFQDTELFELMSTHIGVRFVYEETPKAEDGRQETESREVLAPEALAALPAEWLATLKQGAEETDVEVLFEVIEKIRERDAALADALGQLAEDFEYDEILTLIQGT
ncbi:MAG: response regulator [bacterium]|nr:response regulator [bacterium]